MEKCKYSNNYDLGKTQITDKIRVSTAAIFYDEWFGRRWQIETWCFSDDPGKQKTFQVIHGSIGCRDPEHDIPVGHLVTSAEKIHDYISNNLKRLIK